jgi:hypothetical protein
VAVQTCVRIEVLNHKAGGILPRRGTGKWRVGAWTREPSWRRKESLQTQDPTLLTRPLTPAEARKMRREATEQRINIDLRDLVAGWGLLQYLIVPAAVVSSCILLRARHPSGYRVVGLSCLLLALTCGGLMLYRAYVSSLGW